MFKEKQVFKGSRSLGEEYKDNYLSNNHKHIERKLSRICKHSAPTELCPNNQPIFKYSNLMYFDYACFKYYQERSLHVL